MANDPQFISKSPENPESQSKIIKPARKPRRPARAVARPKKENKKEKQIDSQLTSIYSDSSGRIPNMKQITIKRHHPVLKFFFFLFILGGGLAAAAWSGFLILPEKKFAEEKVLLSVQGPTSAALGATTTYTIRYQNAQNSILKNAVLSVQTPKGFVFSSSQPPAGNPGHSEWNLGDVSRNESREISISGLLFGQPGQEQSWRVFLTYQPENMNSDLQKIAIYNVSVEEPNLTLMASGPSKAIAGNSAEYQFTINKNDGQWPTNKLELKPILPDNFYVASSSPTLGKNKTWTIKIASSSATSSALIFKIAGKFTSSTPNALIKGTLALEAKETGQVYELATASASTAVEDNDINFNLAINGSTSNFNSQPGDLLNISVLLKNMTKMEIKNASVKLTLDAPASKGKSVLNWAEIVDELDGDLRGQQISDDVRRGEIIWDKNKLPILAKLKAGDSAAIDLRLSIKDAEQAGLSDFKSYEIKVIAELVYIDQSNKQQNVSSNPIAIKLNSDLRLEVRDAVSGDAGGKETHKITWILTNNFHPLKNISLSADIYGSIVWPESNSSTVPAGQLAYDAKEQKLSWTIAEMPLDLDVLALPFSFTLNQKNTTQKVLVSKVHVQATDATSGETLDFMGDEVGLNL